MSSLLLWTFAVLIPVDLVFIYLVMWRSVRRYRESGDRKAAIDSISGWMGGYLAICTATLFLVYWPVLRELLTTFVTVLIASFINAVAVALIYALIGRLMARGS